MKILVINCGSSSIKYKLYDMSTRNVIAAGGMERIGLDDPILKFKNADGQSKVVNAPITNHEEGINFILRTLTDAENGAIKSFGEIDAVGHRVVHGGKSTHSVIVTPEVISNLEDYSELAPLHNPAALKGYLAIKKNLPEVKQVFVYDTAFHQTMPDYAYTYALPYDICEKYKIRRYGFHGTSHRFVSARCAEVMGVDLKDIKLITCHLGNGSSITAIKDGKVIDTSMGLTPLDGFIMGSRCGGVDPSAITYLQEKEGWTPAETAEILNKKSGVLGISGISSDDRDVLAAAEAGNERAALARSIQRYQIRKFIGAYVAAMDGVDAIVFTGGIGENTCDLREDVCKHLTYLGVKIDCEKNLELRKGKEGELSTPDSKVRVFVLPTNEELLIARDTKAIVEKL